MKSIPTHSQKIDTLTRNLLSIQDTVKEAGKIVFMEGNAYGVPKQSIKILALKKK